MNENDANNNSYVDNVTLHYWRAITKQRLNMRWGLWFNRGIKYGT